MACKNEFARLYFLFFFLNLYSYVTDAWQNLPLHIMSDGDMQTVALRQTQVVDMEIILIIILICNH